MAIDIKTIVNVSGFEDSILNEVRILLQEISIEVATRLKPMVAELVAAAMKESPEFESLSSGRLREEFGLGTDANGQIEGRDAAESVVQAIIEAISVEPMPAAGGILGGVIIGIFRDDFTDALSARWAEYASVTKSGSKVIPWLRWLLFEGDAVVISGYEIARYSARSGSRTGRTIMVKRSYTGIQGKYNRHPSIGRSGPSQWSVPSEFSGTPQSNWLTRVADKIGPGIEELLSAEVGRLANG